MRKLPLLCWKYVLLSTTDRLWMCHAIQTRRLCRFVSLLEHVKPCSFTQNVCWKRRKPSPLQVL